MVSDVPPGSTGSPPDELVLDGKRQALLRLEQIKRDIDAVEALIETGDAKPAAPPPPKPKPLGKRRGRR